MEEAAACGRLTLRQQRLAAGQQSLSTDNIFVFLLIFNYFFPTGVALAVTAALIAGSVIASMLRTGPGPTAYGTS